MLLDADILQPSGSAFDEPVRLDLDGTMSVHARSLEPGCHIRFDAVIASQGGQCLSWHTLNVTRFCTDAEHELLGVTTRDMRTRADEEMGMVDIQVVHPLQCPILFCLFYAVGCFKGHGAFLLFIRHASTLALGILHDPENTECG